MNHIGHILKVKLLLETYKSKALHKMTVIVFSPPNLNITACTKSMYHYMQTYRVHLGRYRCSLPWTTNHSHTQAAFPNSHIHSEGLLMRKIDVKC